MSEEFKGVKSKEYWEEWYEKPDPWQYQTNPEDLKRKEKILKALGNRRFKKALDIGCGEGWITRDLPADKIYGIEISDAAAKRFPDNVIRIDKPKGDYDLIIATGVMYEENPYMKFMGWIQDHASGLVLTCNIVGVEQIYLVNPIYEEFFPYREYTEHLAVYDFGL